MAEAATKLPVKTTAESKPATAGWPDWPQLSFGDLRRQIDRLFDDFAAPSSFLGRRWFDVEPLRRAVPMSFPAIDVAERDKEYVITAELPGMDEKEIELSVANELLTIKGEKPREVKKADEEKKFHLYERSYGSFLRTFTLPEKVVAEKIAAEMEHGVLKGHVPKAPEVKAAAKKIEIKAK